MLRFFWMHLPKLSMWCCNALHRVPKSFCSTLKLTCHSSISIWRMRNWSRCSQAVWNALINSRAGSRLLGGGAFAVTHLPDISTASKLVPNTNRSRFFLCGIESYVQCAAIAAVHSEQSLRMRSLYKRRNGNGYTHTSHIGRINICWKVKKYLVQVSYDCKRGHFIRSKFFKQDPFQTI